MKCPNDQTEMIEGKTETVQGIPLRWRDKDTGMTMGISSKEIIAFKCPECGQVEFRIEGENK